MTTTIPNATSSGVVTDSGILFPLARRLPLAPELDDSGSQRLSWWDAAGVFAAIVVATAIHLARQEGHPAWNSLWAEDGEVFLSDAHRDVVGSFFSQNGGYVHVVPRAIGGIALLLPVQNAAAVFAIAGSAVIALVAAFVYVASRDVLRARLLRLGLASAVLVLPIVGSELYANALNLHFYLVFGCFWALVWQSETWAAVASRSAVALLAPLSDPLAALLLPLAIVSFLARRTVRTSVVSAAFVSGLGAQFLLMRGGESPERNWAFHLLDLPDIFSLRIAGGLLVGDRLLDDTWLALGRGFSYGALAAVLAILVLLARRSELRSVLFASMALVLAALFFAVHLVGRGTGGMDPELGAFHLNGARYALLPFLFTLTCVLVLVDGLRGTGARFVRAGALLWLVALLGVNYAVGPNERSTGPRWAGEVARARERCLADPERLARIVVAPAPPMVWFARIPCSRL